MLKIINAAFFTSVDLLENHLLIGTALLLMFHHVKHFSLPILMIQMTSSPGHNPNSLTLLPSQ